MKKGTLPFSVPFFCSGEELASSLSQGNTVLLENLFARKGDATLFSVGLFRIQKRVASPLSVPQYGRIPPWRQSARRGGCESV